MTTLSGSLLAKGELRIGEVFWKKNYEWLKEHGYQLRPRYSPDWKPSWQGTKLTYAQCEDGLPLPYVQIIDAIQISNGSRVALKLLDRKVNPHEEDITRYFSTEPLASDPHNRCVPLLDVLHPPHGENEDIRILVLPFLHEIETPLFDTIGEAIECIRQLFEGVQFMHKHQIAHRDLNTNNFMMESEQMFPEGYHLARPSRRPDLKAPANKYTRTQRPPRYFLIDLGISFCAEPDDPSPTAPIIRGGDPTIPEYKNITVPQMNPFPTDVYCAGNIVRYEFLEGHPVITDIHGYKGLEFLKPLIDDMVQDDPDKRPNMDEVIERFEAIVARLSAWRLRSRPSPRRRNIFQNVAYSLSHWRRKVIYIVTRTPSVPCPKVKS